MLETVQKIIRPDFIQIPCILLDDDDIRPTDCFVYAVVYWYTKLKLEKCTASNKTIADIAKVQKESVTNSLSRLSKKGYIQVILDDQNHRLEIIPLVTYGTPPPSNDGSPSIKQLTPPPSNDVHNKNINNNKIEEVKHIDTKVSMEIPVKVDNRNPDIQKGIDLINQLLGHPVTKQGMNRFALKRMYSKFGIDTTLRAIQFAVKVRAVDSYAPGIFNYLDLEQKWDQLVDYGRKNKGNLPKVEFFIAEKKKEPEFELEYIEEEKELNVTPEQLLGARQRMLDMRERLIKA
jgi:hypothetical protein